MTLAGTLALSACSSGQDPASQRNADAAEGGTWTPEAGTYEFTRSGGAAGLMMLSRDGRYSAALSGGELEDGVWRREGSLNCLVPDGRPSDKECFAFGTPDARGRMSGAGPAGTLIMRKME